MQNEEGKPQSLGELIQSSEHQLVVHDQSSGQGAIWVPSARANEDAPLTGDTVFESQSNADAQGTQGEVQGTPGSTNQAAPTPDPEIARLSAELESVRQDAENTKQLLRDNAIQAAKEEQGRFLQSLQGLEPEEQKARLSEFQINRLTVANKALNDQLTHVSESAEGTKQQIAKTQVAHILAQRSGLPPQYAQVLLRAESPEQMEADAAFFASEFAAKSAAQKEQDRQQLTNNPAFKNTGDNAAAPIQQGPKKRSGDLQGLIGSRSYSVVSSQG